MPIFIPCTLSDDEDDEENEDESGEEEGDKQEDDDEDDEGNINTLLEVMGKHYELTFLTLRNSDPSIKIYLTSNEL